MTDDISREYLYQHRKRKRERAGFEAAILKHLGPPPENPLKLPPQPTPLRVALVQLLLERDGDKCYLCGNTLDPATTIVEHIIPRSRGGTDDAWNVALACALCNIRKADHYISLDITSGLPCYHR